MTTPTARKPKVPRPPEAEVLKSCMAIMQAHGWTVYRRNTGMIPGEYKGKTRVIRFGEPGQSDIWGITRSGRHVEVEIKRRGERPTRIQAEWLLRMHNKGCIAFWVADPGVCDQIVRAINRGYHIHYFNTTREYSEKVKGAKEPVKFEGPSGDYELI